MNMRWMILGLLLLPCAAHAQTKGIQPNAPTAPDAPRRAPAPSAVPGARAEPTVVTPADRQATELGPNEALFDAINRGDLPVAKDAISRGADLSATNILGLTPLELAIDLGRNDISFLLLSLRGATGSTALRAAPQQGSAPPASVAAGPSRAERRAQLLADRLASRPLARQAGASLPTAPLYAGGGGTPIPQAGFLGFDGR